MTPEEKVRQMEKMFPIVRAMGGHWVRNNFRKKIASIKYFPTCYTKEVDLSSHGMGKWTFVYMAESKSNIRKGIVAVMAYQKFHVSHSKNPLNNGTGIYLFVLDGLNEVECAEYPPHYFNRIRERMIGPKGIVQPSFDDLVKRVLCDHYNSINEVMIGGRIKILDDGKYGWIADSSFDRQDGYKNMVEYHGDGISLGIMTIGYKLFLTYVPNGMLRQEQIDRKDKALEEQRKLSLDRRYNPDATFIKHMFSLIKFDY